MSLPRALRRGVVLALAGTALVLLHLIIACGDADRGAPAYTIHLTVGAPGEPAAGPVVIGAGEPIALGVHACRNREEPAVPGMPPLLWGGDTYAHWLTLHLVDQDGLACRWRKELDAGERSRELARWRGERRFSYTLDLREWAPPGFPWHPGGYRVHGLASIAGRTRRTLDRVFYLHAVPSSDLPPPSGSPFPVPPARLLQAELAVNRGRFQPGDEIVLEGRLRNVGDRPFLLQTRVPFLEASLVGPSYDRFPKERPTFRPRRADFTRLEPGDEIVFFRERFVAGRYDPDWAMGIRSGLFPPPFALTGTDYEIRFRLDSQGLFPGDGGAEVGIWTGHCVSEPVTVRVDAEPVPGS